MNTKITIENTETGNTETISQGRFPLVHLAEYSGAIRWLWTEYPPCHGTKGQPSGTAWCCGRYYTGREQI